MRDYASPEELINRVARNGLTGESNRLLERSRFYLDHRGLMPTLAQYASASDFLSKTTGLNLRVGFTQMLLSLYPQTRIRMVEFGLSSSVCDELADAAADFFLHCRWPRYRDEVEMEGFLSLLRHQGEKLGFTPLD